MDALGFSFVTKKVPPNCAKVQCVIIKLQITNTIFVISCLFYLYVHIILVLNMSLCLYLCTFRGCGKNICKKTECPFLCVCMHCVHKCNVHVCVETW